MISRNVHRATERCNVNESTQHKVLYEECRFEGNIIYFDECGSRRSVSFFFEVLIWGFFGVSTKELIKKWK